MIKNNALKENITRGWPPERRAAQSKRMKAMKIWKKSTGPKTAKGKAICARNAVKHGYTSQAWRQYRCALAKVARFIRYARLRFESQVTAPLSLSQQFYMHQSYDRDGPHSMIL